MYSVSAEHPVNQSAREFAAGLQGIKRELVPCALTVWVQSLPGGTYLREGSSRAAQQYLRPSDHHEDHGSTSRH